MFEPGNRFYLTAVVYGEHDRVLAEDNVVFTSSNPDVASVSNTGTVVVGEIVSQADIVARVGDVTSEPYHISVRDIHGLPRTMTTVDGVSTSKRVGEVDTIAVKVLDHYGDPVAGVDVTFRTNADPANVPTSAKTNSTGVATVIWRMSTYIFENTLTATMGSAVITFAVTPRPGPTVRIRVPSNYVGFFGGGRRDIEGASVDAYGNYTSSPIISSVSRDAGVATAGTDQSGSVVVTAEPDSRGSTFVAMTTQDGVTDSVLVVCAPAGGVIVGPGPEVYGAELPPTVSAGRELTVPVWADRASALGSATIEVTWDPTLLAYVSDDERVSGLVVNRSEVSAGKLRLSVATGSANGVDSPDVLRITFRVARVAGRAGAVNYRVAEAAEAATFADLLPVTMSVPYSFKVK